MNAREKIVRAILAAREPIKGLPQETLKIGETTFTPRPSPELRGLAQSYMEQAKLPYTPVQNYVSVDVPRAQRIAREYEAMPHTPGDPATMRSYDALARETRDQYEALRKLGVKFEPLPAGVPDPYAASPRLANKDFLENKHLYYFPTEQGFGSGNLSKEAIRQNPMLAPSGVKIEGKEVPFNDLFRVVHDAFGHFKEGVGFRAAGEENAWRSHGRMYSPQALPAMTAETRGQNSWVNFGPSAAQNKGASAAETIYAPQKVGNLPDWVIQAGRMSPLGIAGVIGAGGIPDKQRMGDVATLEEYR